MNQDDIIKPNIVFHTAGNEVMRIDERGIRVNPAYSVDEATQHVLNALSEHIQRMVVQAVDAEREACAKVCEDYIEWGREWGQDSNHMAAEAATNECARAIRERENK